MAANRLEDILNRYLAAGALLSAHIDLTHRCPLRCRHCYLGGAGKNRKELSLEELTSCFHTLSDLGAFGLLFSGGEILLRSDLLELIRRARAHGFVIHLKTSGFGANREVIQGLASSGVSEVDISFYSHLPEIHDQVTRVPGSFRQALALARGLEPEVRVRAVVTLLQGYGEDPAQIDGGLRALGISEVLFNDLAGISCDGYPLQDLWLPESKLRDQWRHMMGGSATTISHTPDEPICKAGLTTLYISPEGEVKPCVEYPLSGGNLRLTPLKEIWERSEVFLQARRLRYGSMTACTSCAYKNLCQACPARSLKETGAADKPAPSICARARVWASIVKQGEE